MKNIAHKITTLNEVQWALIGVGLFLTVMAVLALTGVYKVDVIH